MAHGDSTVRSEMVSIPEKPSTHSILASCSILNSLTEAERETVASSCFMAYAERGELMWLAGTPMQFAAIVE